MNAHTYRVYRVIELFYHFYDKTSHFRFPIAFYERCPPLCRAFSRIWRFFAWFVCKFSFSVPLHSNWLIILHIIPCIHKLVAFFSRHTRQHCAHCDASSWELMREWELKRALCSHSQWHGIVFNTGDQMRCTTHTRARSRSREKTCSGKMSSLSVLYLSIRTGADRFFTWRKYWPVANTWKRATKPRYKRYIINAHYKPDRKTRRKSERKKNTTSADGRKTISLQSIEYIRIDCSHDERMRYVNHGKQRDNFNL